MLILILILLVVFFMPMLQPRERAPIVIVQRERDYDNSGFNPFTIILVGMMFFLFSMSDVFKNLPTLSFKETKNTSESQRASLANSFVPVSYKTISSDVPEQSQNIQQAPNQEPKLEYLVPPVKEEIKVPKPKLNPYWVVLLKRYQYADLERLSRLQEHFFNRNIQAIPMSNGEYWAAILVENESQGNTEVRDWNRHRQDWVNMNLIMEVKDLNNN